MLYMLFPIFATQQLCEIDQWQKIMQQTFDISNILRVAKQLYFQQNPTWSHWNQQNKLIMTNFNPITFNMTWSWLTLGLNWIGTIIY